MRSARERLLDIVDAITKIESRMPADEPTFFADELLQVWMVHHVMIIGEAVRALDRHRFEHRLKFGRQPGRVLVDARLPPRRDLGVRGPHQQEHRREHQADREKLQNHRQAVW